MPADSNTVLRDTQRLHKLRAMVAGPIEAAGHAVRWHNLRMDGYSYARCVKRGCYKADLAGSGRLLHRTR